jgi:hypothetical protein
LIDRDLFDKATAGDAGAQLAIAGLYATGEGVPQDYARAADLILLFFTRRHGVFSYFPAMSEEGFEGPPAQKSSCGTFAASNWSIALCFLLAKSKRQICPVLGVG